MDLLHSLFVYWIIHWISVFLFIHSFPLLVVLSVISSLYRDYVRSVSLIVGPSVPSCASMGVLLRLITINSEGTVIVTFIPVAFGILSSSTNFKVQQSLGYIENAIRQGKIISRFLMATTYLISLLLQITCANLCSILTYTAEK